MRQRVVAASLLSHVTKETHPFPAGEAIIYIIIISSPSPSSASSSPLEGGHARSCGQVSSFINRFLYKDEKGVAQVLL
jgi:hypothetical protein